jgi:hypothetical protein
VGGVSFADLLGVFGAVMTLVTFAQTDFVRMRLAAIVANLGFIAFGLATPCYPVLGLHLVLLPLNLRHLIRCRPRPLALRRG